MADNTFFPVLRSADLPPRATMLPVGRAVFVSSECLQEWNCLASVSCRHVHATSSVSFDASSETPATVLTQAKT